MQIKLDQLDRATNNQSDDDAAGDGTESLPESSTVAKNGNFDKIDSESLPKLTGTNCPR